MSRALDRALSDSSVSAVVALGPIGSHLLARAGEPRKPAIAATIVDASWQGIPQKDGASGVHNLAYVDESYALSGTVADFHRMIPFRRMAVLLDPELLGGDSRARGQRPLSRPLAPAPGRWSYRRGARPIRSWPRCRPTPTPCTSPRIPALGEAETARLIAGLERAAAAYAEPHRRRRARGRAGVLRAARALAAPRPPGGGGPPADPGRRGRRHAAGAAGRRPAAHPQPRHRADDRVLARLQRPVTDAELVGTDSLGPADTVSLADAMRGAAAANLDLKAADLEVESGAQDVRTRPLQPASDQVESRFGGTVTPGGDRGREPGPAAPAAARRRALVLGAALLGAGVGRLRLGAAPAAGPRSQREQTRLDVVLDAAQAYISVLQARTLAEVRRSNLYRNRSNLETARVRESVGSTSRADLYRWQGEVANARRDVIAAESQVQVATLALKRVLNRPLDRPLAERPVTLGDPALLAQDSTVLTWFGDPARYAVLTRFLVGEALRVSPELTQRRRGDRRPGAAAHRRGARVLDADALAAGRARQRLQPGRRRQQRADAAGRHRPGHRARPAVAVPDPGVAAALHRIRARRRRRAQAGIDLEQLKVERAGAAQAVEQRVRAALETAASSYAAIALTREASDAASRNYELVSDGYARGTASITALIDAQNAAESSAEAAANAVHDFLLDLMRVERAMGDFGALRPAEQQQAFLERLHTLEEQR